MDYYGANITNHTSSQPQNIQKIFHPSQPAYPAVASSGAQWWRALWQLGPCSGSSSHQPWFSTGNQLMPMDKAWIKSHVTNQKHVTCLVEFPLTKSYLLVALSTPRILTFCRHAACLQVKSYTARFSPEKSKKKTGWWFQPIWILWVKGKSSPNRDENKKIFKTTNQILSCCRSWTCISKCHQPHASRSPGSGNGPRGFHGVVHGGPLDPLNIPWSTGTWHIQ